MQFSKCNRGEDSGGSWQVKREEEQPWCKLSIESMCELKTVYLQVWQISKDSER